MDASLQAVLAATTSIFIVTLIFVVIYLVYQGTSKSPPRHRQSRRIKSQSTTSRNYELSSITTTTESASFDTSLSEISMAELVPVTGNFATKGIIGDGSFGLVYKATLSNGVTVAVKKLNPDAFQVFCEFLAEMDTLSRLRHPNILKIQGKNA